MFSSARSLARSLLMFMALVLLMAAVIQPATFSHAQGTSSPPPPPPTEGPTVGGQPVSHDPISVSELDQAKDDSPSETPEARRSVPASPAPAVATAPQSVNSTGAVGPQATQPPNTFHINVIASATATANGLLTYSIYFTNTAPVAYQNVIIQNGIGGGQQYTGCDSAATCPFTYTGDIPKPTILSGFGNGGSYNGREIIWSLGTVQPQQKGRISYTVRVFWDLYPKSERLPAVLGNTVALYKDGVIDSNNKLNEDQWGVLVVGPVFFLTKTVNKTIALQGNQLNYTLTLGNKTNPNDATRLDARDAHNVQLADILPPQLDPATVVVGEGGRKETRGNDTWVIWDIPTLAVGATQVRHFNAQIRGTLSACNAIDNDQGHYGVTSDEIPRNDQGNITYVPGWNNAHTDLAPPATIDIQVTNTGPIYVGDVVTFVINAKSYWDSPISNASVRFYVPSAFTYVSSTPNGGVSGGVVTWSGVTLPAKPNSTDFGTPSLTQFTVQARAGREIDAPPANHAYAEFVKPLPGGVPDGCLIGFDRGVPVEPLLYANKSVDTSTAVLSGTDVIYTVELLNISSQTLTNVTLVDNIPSPPGGPFVFRNMVSGQAPTSVTSTAIRWDSNLTVPGGSKTAPGRTTLRFRMTARGWPGECRDNRVFPDSPASRAREAVGGLVCIAFPFGLSKTVDRIAVNPSDTNRTLQFTITFRNLIGTSLRITPRDRLEAPYSFRAMVQGPAPNNGGVPINGYITWPDITLSGNQTVVYKFTMDLPVGQDGIIPPGVYCNRGGMIVYPTEQYGPGWVSEPPACTAVSSLELHVEKWLNRREVGLGEVVTYGVNITNNSDSLVSQLVVSDTLPVNMAYVGPGISSPAPTVTVWPNGQQLLRWENVFVAAHTTTTISFLARAPALIGGNLNVAEVTGGNPVPYFTCQGGFSAAGACQGKADMIVSNLVTIDPQANPASVKPGDIVTYTVSLVSNNNIPYVNTTITDTLPLGFTFLDTVEGPAPYRPRPDVLIWSNQTIPPKDGNNPGRLKYVFRARAPQAYGSFRSRVEATSPTGVIPTVDNAARVLITPPTPALSLTGPSLVEIGGDITYRISLVNPLATPLTGLTVNDALPAGFTYVITEAGTLPPTVSGQPASGQTLTWSNITVPAQAGDGTPGIVEFVFHVKAPDTEGTGTNTATVSGGSVQIDQTYNTVQTIVARLSYIFMPFISTGG